MNLDRKQRLLLACLVLAVFIIGWSYAATYQSLVAKWRSDAAYSHCFLILPMCAWLVWRKRRELAACNWTPSPIGILGLTFAAFVWVVASGTGVLVAEQFAAVGMIVSAVIAILGWPVARVLAFPLGFLFLVVPFGRALVPFFMQITAAIATAALEASGVPIYRDSMYLTIPAGSFEVARECSGLNYVLTGLVLGLLYSYLSFSGWRKRLLSLSAFLVIPVVANGLRVYATIGLSHLTDMRFGPGTEHIAFGRVLFVVLMLGMFWVGNRWRDDQVDDVASCSNDAQSQMSWLSWLIVATALVLPAAGPEYLHFVASRYASVIGDAGDSVVLPRNNGAWRGPEALPDTWKPGFEGAKRIASGSYFDSAGKRIDAFVGIYGLGAIDGPEMLAYSNRIAKDELHSVPEERKNSFARDTTESVVVVERALSGEDGPRLVWYWYMVGDRPASSRLAVKWWEARAFAGAKPVLERILTLSVPVDDGNFQEARHVLERFAQAHQECIVSGYSPDRCRG